MSWVSAAYFGAKQKNIGAVLKWTEPCVEAFVAGCWLLYWTEDTLYWVAKPTLHKTNNRQLHRGDGPAFVCDIDDMYFWQGIMVSEDIIMRPETITTDSIEAEPNQEIRRVMIERYGYDRYMQSANIVHQDRTGRLRKKKVGNDTIAVIEVVNGTAEIDGTFRRYVLSVPPEMQTACEAVAWTYGMTEKQYANLRGRT